MKPLSSLHAAKPANGRSKLSCITLSAGLLFGLALLLTLLNGPISRAATPNATQPATGAGNPVTSTASDSCWQVVSNPNPPGTFPTFLSGVAAVSTNDVWAVGQYGNGSPPTSLIEHWNGTSWSVVSSPNRQSTRLTAVAAVSANDVWAVGYNNNYFATYDTVIEHWNGTAWSLVDNPPGITNSSYLYGVAAVSANDVWAVGYDTGTGGLGRTLVEHWDGTAWSVVPGAAGFASPNYLYGVVALSSNDVWAVGDYYTATAPRTNQTLIEHWNGSAWSVVPSPNQGSGPNHLKAVAAVSPNDVWAVGNYQDTSTNVYQTLVEHWNGTAWSEFASPNQGTDANYLAGVAAVSANDVWVVGYEGDDIPGVTSRPIAEHWDGTAWSLVSLPNPSAVTNVLFGVAAVSANDVWAVGYYRDDSTSKYPMLIEHFTSCGGATPTATAPVSSTNTPSPPLPTATATPTLGPGQFYDVPPGSPFYAYVSCLATRNIVSGYGDGTFRPSNPVTRGQLSKIVSNSAGYTETFTTNTFEDVAVGSTFFPYVERLFLHGGIGGYPCGGVGEPCVPPANKPYFRPGALVTRGQTSKIVAIAKGLPAPSPGQQTFEDVAPNSTFWQWIEPLAATGAIGGYPCGGVGEPCVPPNNRPYFRPGANVTRGQSAKIVANAFFPNCSTVRQSSK